MKTVGRDETANHGPHFLAYVHEAQDKRQSRQRRGGNHSPDGQRQQHDQRGITRRPPGKPHAQRLAHRREAAASGQRSHQHEQGEHLPDRAQRRLRRRGYEAGNGDIGHAHAHMAEHEAELRHGEKNDFTRTRGSAGRGRRGAHGGSWSGC